ncbi:MAG TPA: ABC transporter ATP-binding protein [Planctomycetota bacterium]|nr:ABC transporter ATP-binding protein [Planctomycetota bacterium]
MIRVRDLNLRIGTFALRDLSLQVAQGDYFVLLGPTGSGKTLFIECLCGLLRPDAGTIEIDGRDVTHLAPRLRGIGYVPQHQGLFPHLSVEDNIAFPLRTRRLPRAEIKERVGPLVDLLGIGPLLRRWPAHLSGGERQKVALARALAPHPKLLLLDEPVSALDESSRERLCSELHRIHEELQITTLHVSHSVEEALSIGNRAGVLNAGEVVQTGSLTELLRRPASEFVARFFRTENIVPAAATPLPGGGSELSFAGHQLRVAGHHEGSVTFVIRAESLAIHPKGAAVSNGIEATLTRLSERGLYRRLEFRAGVPLVAFSTLPAETFRVGESYRVALPPEAIHVLPPDSLS